jgi:hypothetical protein
LMAAQKPKTQMKPGESSARCSLRAFSIEIAFSYDYQTVDLDM